MKNTKIILFLIFLIVSGFKPLNQNTFDVGEKFIFKINYQLINAGIAILEVKEAIINNKKVYHMVGKGYTTGLSKFFFKVDDTYETFIDKGTQNPQQFVRNINEGGYTKNQEGFFNDQENTVLVKDYKHKTENTFSVPKNTQDILSSFYYLRSYPNIDKMKIGDSVSIDMFFDNKTTKFRLKFIGREDLKTKFGLISTMVFKPFLQTGRVFKEEEGLTIWISDDENRMPIKLKASLLVGSIKAELDSYKGLKNPISIKKNKNK